MTIEAYCTLFSLTACSSFKEKRKIDISSIKLYSNIKLKKKRSMKKFLKNPRRYLDLNPKVNIPLVKRVFSETISSKIVPVSPMSSPSMTYIHVDFTFEKDVNHLGIEI